MYKKLFVAFLLSTTVLASSATISNATESTTGGAPSVQERTLIVTAKGKLNATLVPYYDKGDIEGFESGIISLFYKSSNTGFVDGDNSYLTVELPKEFATIAQQKGFVDAISGSVTRKTLLGDKTTYYSSQDIQVSGNMLAFKIPSEFWLVHGEISTDIKIDYGRIQKKFPMRLIKNNSSGYLFKSSLRRSMAPWDPLENPIIGNNSADEQLSDTSAYWD